MSAPFRFGVNMATCDSRAAWIEKCRRAEGLGYDVIGVPDHLGVPSPLPAMLLAAEATERVRLNSFVLNVPFYNPVLLARDVATVDQLSDGRVELGLGAGYVQSEFETAGIPFPSAGRRVEHVAEAAATLRRLFADPEYRPRPAQPDGPPLLIAGWGERLLRVAAEHAQVIGFTGAVTGTSGHLTLVGPHAFAGRIDYVRGLLGNRAGEVEFNILVQALTTPDEVPELEQRFAKHLPEGDREPLAEFPTVLVGSPEQMAAQLRERREKYGITYITVHEPELDKFAPVIELLR
ncbi:LLM class F420-dependent oxidoreductase [Nocardia transvalensis]|uniref:LLM class F420-dependent oxidoreductase n=1 Tax=Nocardia transvalensis TaxID=37333 RepID=UPI001893980C|nr:LLM class F420-dependent oxidoreductase [Nocardia transvalensis]MBF6328215.1 LLM class F420-dependent oxidoreductase [Nocardia transvalensis]